MINIDAFCIGGGNIPKKRTRNNKKAHKKTRRNLKKGGLINFLSKKNVLDIRSQLRSKPDQNYYVQEHDNKLLIIKGPALPRKANPKPFMEYIEKAKKRGKKFAKFYNQDKSTYMIVPVQESPNITHFAKKSSEADWLDLWKLVKEKITKSKNKLYVSTHGHGVSQLHVRIESHPKYYIP